MLSRYSLMTAILAKGSNPDLANDLGYRSMQIAIEKKDLNSVEILKNYNADIGFQDKFGNNYLIHSAMVNSFELVEFFTNFININSCNQDGLNAISFAQANKNNLIIDLLLAKGAKFIDEKNICGSCIELSIKIIFLHFKLSNLYIKLIVFFIYIHIIN